MPTHIAKKNGRPVYLCHGCNRPLSAALVAENRTTHKGCEAEAMRKFEVSEARKLGIPVATYREQQKSKHQEWEAGRTARVERAPLAGVRVARIYERVSTDEQDLTRQSAIEASTRAAGFYVAGVYREKASGARADRPELLRMIEDLQHGEVVVAEKIDRISRLPLPEAERLIASIRAKGARLAVPGVVDLSELAAEAQGVAKIVLESVQDMLLKLALQMARDDYETRRDRQQQGVELARAAGKYTGRRADAVMHGRIVALRGAGHSIAETARLAGCSASQVKRVWAMRERSGEMVQTQPTEPAAADDDAGAAKVATIVLRLRVENNNSFVRGKKRARENIERWCLSEYDARRLPSGEYELKVPYSSDEELDATMHELLGDIASEADDRHCFSESDARVEGTDRHW
jgi:DNA invertase Pin-like site-specific DNA recombinase